MNASAAVTKSMFQRQREFLHSVFAPFPGRAGFAWRLVLASAVVIIFSSAYQVPYLSLSILAVFYTNQANAVFTRIVGVLLIITAVLSCSACILMLRYTFDYPLYRIIVAGGILFLSMYFMRILKIGPLFLGPAIVCIYGQTFADMTDLTEYLVHQTFWSFVALVYAIGVSIIISTWLFPNEPDEQLRDEEVGQLTRLAANLEKVAAGRGVGAPLSPRQREASIISMGKFLTAAGIGNKGTIPGGESYRQAVAASVSELIQAEGNLPESTAPVPVAERLREEILSLAECTAGNRVYHQTWTPGKGDMASLKSQPELADMHLTLAALDGYRPPENPPKKPEAPMVAADVRTNPVYHRFALKVVMATMLTYVFYNGVNWEGIHTAMLTCVLVAYPTLGSSMRRIMLRFYGAVLGSAAALFLFVFVMPRLDGITGLLVSVLPFLAVGAWLAAGAERIAYVGTQMVFTLAMALFDHSGPTTDLTEIRDRIIGILLGVSICYVLYPRIWPESETGLVRKKMGEIIRAVGDFLQPLPAAGTVSAGAGPGIPPNLLAAKMDLAQRRIRCQMLLGDCDEILGRVALEPEYRTGDPALLLRRSKGVLEQCRKIMRARDEMHGLPHPATFSRPETEGLILAAREAAKRMLDAYGAALENAAPPPQEERRRLLEAAKRLSPHADGAEGPLVAGVLRLVDSIAALPDWPEANPPRHAVTPEASQS